jgi:polyisoprenoid-binding protein YceI
MLQRILGALALALSCAAGAQILVPEKSEVRFTTRQMGVPVAGYFTKFSAQLALDPKKPEAGKVTIWIDTASMSFGARETEEEAARPVWIDSRKYPQATFRSTAIKPQGGGRYDVVGQLEMKGRAREIIVPVTVVPQGDVAVASGQFNINRLEFGIGEGLWADTSTVAANVVVRFKFTLAGVPPG